MAGTGAATQVPGLHRVPIAGDSPDPDSMLLRKSALLFASEHSIANDSQRVFELSEGYSRTSEALRDQPLFIGLEGV